LETANCLLTETLKISQIPPIIGCLAGAVLILLWDWINLGPLRQTPKYTGFHPTITQHLEQKTRFSYVQVDYFDMFDFDPRTNQDCTGCQTLLDLAKNHGWCLLF